MSRMHSFDRGSSRSTDMLPEFYLKTFDEPALSATDESLFSVFCLCDLFKLEMHPSAAHNVRQALRTHTCKGKPFQVSS